MKKAPAKSATAKHTPPRKHAGKTAKHNPPPRKAARGGGGGGPAAATVVAKPAAHAKARQWSPDEDVALCSARAVAESLRLATGRAVSDSAVLDVYWATAADADAGASVLATLEAAFKVLGRRPAFVAADCRTPLILGLGGMPEPHAVAVGPDGTWWSWGEPFDPCDWAGLVVEEAWAVQWL